MPYAFVSYQTADKVVAGKIRDALAEVGIQTFLAHEDIFVSEEWRLKILEQIGVCDIFICILSQSYLASPWCVQESGIAAFLGNVTIIPLSIDGTVPPGFVGNVQSVKVDPASVYISDFIQGFVKYNFDFAAGIMINIIASAKSFRGAEAKFKIILPYLDRLSPEQAKRLLEVSLRNDQVLHASLCITQYLPPLAQRYGALLSESDQKELFGTLARYNAAG